MRKRYFLIPLLLIFSAGVAYTVLRSSVHHFTDEQCPDCHAVTSVKGKRETLKMTASIPYLCGRCHGDREDALSHPVEVVPREAVLPPDLPLSWEGRMTCSTCHDIHAAPLAAVGGRIEFLRRPATGPAFCSACHAEGISGGRGHVLAMGRAHMKYNPEDGGGPIDAISRECLSCHDGSIGPNETVGSGAWEHGVPLSRFDPRGSHPIGVDYMLALARRGGLHPISALNPAIKLIAGKVGCSSCHNPYSKERYQLVMSNSGSGLCLSCHDK